MCAATERPPAPTPAAARHATSGNSVRLSKWGYRADFVVYPVLIALLAVHSLWHAAPPVAGRWVGAAAAGLAAWTALEYALHRWVLHRMAPFSRLHALHHEHPGASIGTPTWLSVSLFFAVWMALAQAASMPTAGGLTTGLTLGYLAYAIVHDAVHHRRSRRGSWLHRTKVRHARHHAAHSSTDFGVSTGLWDVVLRTAHRPARRHATPVTAERRD